MRRAIVLVALTLSAGCTVHSGRGESTPVMRHHLVQLRRPGEACLAAWNSRANSAARAATLPPLGAYRIGGDGPRIRPQGGYEVFVGESVSIGVGTMGSHCIVSFRFPLGFRGGPAAVEYTERGVSGVFVDPEVVVGTNADFGTTAYDQRLDGTLYARPSGINLAPPL